MMSLLLQLQQIHAQQTRVEMEYVFPRKILLDISADPHQVKHDNVLVLLF